MNYPLCLDSRFEPFYPPYLDKMVAVINQAQRAHPRVLVARMTLRLTMDALMYRRHWLAPCFIDALRTRLMEYCQEYESPESSISYLWTRDEYLPCYHAVVFLNQDTFGNQPSGTRLTDTLHPLFSQAWGATLGVTLSESSQLYERSNELYLLNPDDAGYWEEINRLTWHLSGFARDRKHDINPEARALESSAW